MLAAVPLLLGLIPRNRIIGFRTRDTMSSDAAWYRSNRVAGCAFLIAGAVWALAALVAPRDVTTVVALVALACAIAVSVWTVYRMV